MAAGGFGAGVFTGAVVWAGAGVAAHATDRMTIDRMPIKAKFKVKDLEYRGKLEL